VSPGNLFFALMAALCLGGAIVTIGARNPIRSAVGLLITIVGIAGLFLKLNAQFLAAIQLIVYAGAVVVLFVFVIMLLGPDATAAPQGMPRTRVSRWFAGLAMVVFALAGGVLFLLARPRGARLREVPPEFGGVEAVGRELFTKTIVPFELATALLIVAVVGAIAVARSKHKPRQRLSVEQPLKLFHGPLIPRDAGRPLPKEHA